jgi:hypothetical protein
MAWSLDYAKRLLPLLEPFNLSSTPTASAASVSA